MATRKKAPATIIKEQASEIASQREQIEKLTKELSQENSSKNSHYNNWRELSNEKEEIHTMLDCLPDAPARRTEPPEGSYRSPVELSLIARLSVWIANLEARRKG